MSDLRGISAQWFSANACGRSRKTTCPKHFTWSSVDVNLKGKKVAITGTANVMLMYLQAAPHFWHIIAGGPDDTVYNTRHWHISGSSRDAVWSVDQRTPAPLICFSSIYWQQKWQKSFFSLHWIFKSHPWTQTPIKWIRCHYSLAKLSDSFMTLILSILSYQRIAFLAYLLGLLPTPFMTEFFKLNWLLFIVLSNLLPDLLI